MYICACVRVNNDKDYHFFTESLIMDKVKQLICRRWRSVCLLIRLVS